MPERANSFHQVIPCIVFVSSAMFAVNFESTAQADSACIEQPGQAAAGTHWVPHFDPSKNRECWTLVDVFGRETGVWGGPVMVPQAQPNAAPAPTPPTQRESSHGNFNLTGASANLTPERNAPQISHPGPPHKPQSNVATANKEDTGIRADEKGNGKGHVARRVSLVTMGREESAEFEEFLRWRQHERLFQDFLRWYELQRLTETKR